MARLYGPIDREVQIAEMRHLRMLSQLETNRLIAQAREENGSRVMDGGVSGLDRIYCLVSRPVQSTFSRSRRSLGSEVEVAA